MSDALPLLLLDGAACRARADAIVDCYRAAFTAPGYDEGEAEVQRFATSQLPGHLNRDGFRLAAALEGDAVRGFGYGYTGRRGQYWSDLVAAAVPDKVAETWVGGHFELVELAVDPAHQGRGLGGRLLDTLLTGLPHRRALLGTYPDERPSVRLYRSRGWRWLASIDRSSDLWGLDLADRLER